MSEQRRITAVIYDVDGTMVDSEPLHVAAWDAALHSFGRALGDLPEAFRATMAGKKPIAIAEGMVQELGLPMAPDKLLAEKSDLFLRMAETDLEGMPGVVASVQRLHHDGYTLAIGTSLDREYVSMVLARLGLQDAFAVIVTGDQIKQGKPHPETYQTVAEKLGVPPSACVVLEDATSGIRAAKAAGAWCIAVENRAAAPQNVSEADVVVHSLDAVTRGLIERLTRNA